MAVGSSNPYGNTLASMNAYGQNSVGQNRSGSTAANLTPKGSGYDPKDPYYGVNSGYKPPPITDPTRTYDPDNAAAFANQLATQSLAPMFASNQFTLDQANQSAQWDSRAAQYDAGYNQRTGDIAKKGIGLGVTQAERDYDVAQRGNKLDVIGTNIDIGAAERQQGYINDMLAYTNQDIGARGAIQNLDMGAMERQFPLLATARQDIEQKQGLLRQDLQAVDTRHLKDERLGQLRLMSEAAAAGGTGSAMQAASARDAATSLQLDLAENERTRQKGEIEYQAALRDNTEKQAQARDAIEKIKLEKQRLEIEKQRAARQAEEDRQKAADALKKAQLEQYYNALKLQDAQNALQKAKENAFIQLAQQQQEQARNAFIAEANRQKAAQAQAEAQFRYLAQQQQLQAQQAQQAAAYAAQIQENAHQQGLTQYNPPAYGLRTDIGLKAKLG